MIPILTTAQIRQADAYTIRNEPIGSVDLMERASKAFVKKFVELAGRGHRIRVFSGTGNNGGDGLAIARLLMDRGYDVQAFTIGELSGASEDFTINFRRLSERVAITHLEDTSDFPEIRENELIIDGLFGSGLSRPVRGLYADLIRHINSSAAWVFSIDIASGLYADQPLDSQAVVQPDFTISFQVPKLAFFQPGLSPFVGDWHVVDIGLDQKMIGTLNTPYYLTEQQDIPPLIPRRNRFDHKGHSGRILLVTGSKGKMGASVLCARAALRSGAGLVFIHVPVCGTNILQTAVPEAMVHEDEHEEVVTEVIVPALVNAVGAGPGLGTDPFTVKALKLLIEQAKAPLVLDADAINILSEYPGLQKQLPAGTILTPHLGEFKRLVGSWRDDYHKIELLRHFCQDHQVNVVLKGAFSAVCSRQGTVCFNPTGNPGMATGGTGDVLTGIVTALLGKGLDPFDALKLGVYLHGRSGDLAVKRTGLYSLIASDIVDHLPSAFLGIKC